MTNLLLITDVPRLRKVFSRLSEEKDVRLRIANSLEKGAEEIVADKPDVVFVQTHLSGLSADIILMHLKKQLGRRRSRFVLLSPRDQASTEVLKLYQGHLDTSPDNSDLFDNIREAVAGLAAPKRKKDAAETIGSAPAPPQHQQESAETAPVRQPDVPATGQQPDAPMPSEAAQPLMLQQMPEHAEPSLEEQGVTYSPRPRLSVYSEFTSSFDNAVNSMQPAEPVPDPQAQHHHDWDHGDIEIVEAPAAGSKRTTFLLWLAPVLVAVIVVTMLQHRKSKPAALTVTPAQPVAAPSSANKPATPPPVAAGTKAPSAPAPTPALPQKPAAQTAAAGVEGQLSERAVLSAIAENRGSGQAKGTPAPARPTALPDFIPRYGLDKKYGAANPGWERYKGEVTEFKVFREGGAIKAIQVIDRGGQGVPESFMKAVLRQVSKKPAFTLEAADRKEGYEIQRGQVADNLNVVYYRDEQGGRLRAFVLTWK